MSILQQVMKEYGISETSEAPTDKTDKRVKSPDPLTDRTDKRASVSFVSEWLEELKTKSDDSCVHEMIQITQMRYEGKTPDHYTSTTTCNRCGPVPIWEGCPPKVLGCPWCFNRLKGLPIPHKSGDDFL